ncbi:hypothetical protein D3C78_129590 [compost metagenome]
MSAAASCSSFRLPIAVWSLPLSEFAVSTAEFAIAGILLPAVRSLGTSDDAAGNLITACVCGNRDQRPRPDSLSVTLRPKEDAYRLDADSAGRASCRDRRPPSRQREQRRLNRASPISFEIALAMFNHNQPQPPGTSNDSASTNAAVPEWRFDHLSVSMGADHALSTLFEDVMGFQTGFRPPFPFPGR